MPAVEISQERFELALRELRSSDWERFERLASTFLASEWTEVRTMASPSGDGGRDSELFSPTGKPNVVIQYSIQEDWSSKISRTVKRLRETFPNAKILVFVSNQQIGAKADEIRKRLLDEGFFLDVKDRSWFVERANIDQNRSNAAAELARVVVDPLLESEGLATRRSSSALTGQEAKTALFYLEMQWRDTNSAKGLTRASFEALVRAALHGTDSSNKIGRTEVHARVHSLLPQHNIDVLVPFIDAALHRMTKSAIRHWPQDDEFNLSYEEIERVKDRAAGIALLIQAFDADVRDIIKTAGIESETEQKTIANLAHRIIDDYFLQSGEEFAASVTHDAEPPVNDADLKSIITKLSPSLRLSKDRENVHFLLHVVLTLITNPSEATKEYLRLLSDSYTLFAFLEEVPDVQKITKKLFNNGQIWLDTSVLLPIFAEQSFPETMRPFTALFKQAKAAGIKLFVTSGIIEEIERHFNLCVTYTRTTGRWEGRVPYVFARYSLGGRPIDGFSSWVEQFRGAHQPIQDIADYLLDFFAIELSEPIISNKLDPAVVMAVREYWKQMHDTRRQSGGQFSISANRLAEHDAENCISVISEREMEKGRSPLGYTSWWLSLDSAARNMLSHLESNIARKIRHSPVISIDFLLKYLAFGPARDRISSIRLPYVFATPVLEIPQDLLDVARQAREENVDLPERLIQRRIRDALDRAKMKIGPVQFAGLDGASGAISDMF